MRRIADVGAAVIGTGFIGTVHVEALRRIGVQVRGVLGSTPERGAARADALGVPRAYASIDDLLSDPAVDVVHVTSPNDLHLPHAKAALAAGRHVVCEKPLAMSATESAELVELAARTGLVNAVNFNIRYYPLNQHAHEVVAAGDIGGVRLVTGRYFQDWLLLESDWNWRLEPGRGGALRAVGDIGSHWLDLMTFVTGQRIVEVMADLSTFVRTRRRAGRTGRDLLDRGRHRDRHPGHRHRGRGDDPAPLRGRRPRHRSASARSAPAGRTRCSTRSTGRARRSPGIPSSPTRSGSAIATARTRS